MKIITSPTEFEKTLIDLLDEYKILDFAVAWAGVGTKIFAQLIQAKVKIRKGVVGTHFYQTHPGFISEFIDSDCVKFILQSSGVFHPKIYLFSNSNVDWECLVGSANLTKSACTENAEIVAHISSNDEGSRKVLKKLQAQIKTYWNESESISNEDYNHYRNVWKSSQKRLKMLSGSYGKKKKNKPIVKSEIYSMEWSSYVNKVRNDKHHSLTKRLDLLERVRKIFQEYSKFNKTPLNLRQGIAGFASEDEIPWGWFGSMRGAGKFKNRINNNDINISRALDQISLSGEITRKDFESYIEKFIAAFPDGRDGIAIASRLLAMKRPDVFVCLDAQNLKGLTAEFGIKRTGMTYERYWDEIIAPIFDSVWWNQRKPKKSTESRIWMGRAAMLDAIFYEPRPALYP